MRSRIRYTAAGALLAAASLLTGCETTQIAAQLPPAPAAQLGPQFEVLKAPRYKYVINGVMDKAGRAHLIYANGQEAGHLVIGPQGVESREIIRPHYRSGDTLGGLPHSVDLAFDRAGTLHALLSEEHLVKKDGAWLGGQRTPWQEAHIEPLNEYPGDISFVKGAPDLTWAFYLPGSAMGIETELDWVKVLLAIPQTEDMPRMVVVAEETPYRHWHMLDMDAEDRVHNLRLLSGSRGGVTHAIYDIGVLGVLRATFRADAPCAGPADGTELEPLKLANGTPVCPVVGFPVINTPPAPAEGRPSQRQDYTYETIGSSFGRAPSLSFSVDAGTGTILVTGRQRGNSVLVQRNAKPGKLVEMPIKDAVLVLASAGKNRFHALAAGLDSLHSTLPMYYLTNIDGVWSAPVEIGTYADDFIQLGSGAPLRNMPQNDAYRIMAGDDGRALLIWPTEDALVARWVRLK